MSRAQCGADANVHSPKRAGIDGGAGCGSQPSALLALCQKLASCAAGARLSELGCPSLTDGCSLLLRGRIQISSSEKRTGGKLYDLEGRHLQRPSFSGPQAP